MDPKAVEVEKKAAGVSELKLAELVEVAESAAGASAFAETETRRL
jgi:hypothetical protein